jgi:hypothetical protein
MSTERESYSFTIESLAAGGADLAAVEEWFADWLDTLEGQTWDDIMDRLESTPWQRPDGEWVDLDLPGRTDDPVYKRLIRIGKRVRREMNA